MCMNVSVCALRHAKKGSYKGKRSDMVKTSRELQGEESLYPIPIYVFPCARVRIKVRRDSSFIAL